MFGSSFSDESSLANTDVEELTEESNNVFTNMISSDDQDKTRCERKIEKMG